MNDELYAVSCGDFKTEVQNHIAWVWHDPSGDGFLEPEPPPSIKLKMSSFEALPVDPRVTIEAERVTGDKWDVTMRLTLTDARFGMATYAVEDGRTVIVQTAWASKEQEYNSMAVQGE